jgi:hypothetical protein
VYLAGYALEYSLKRKICSTLNFRSGFPDQKSEFLSYVKALSAATYILPVAKITEIRNHDLSKLLFYSGSEYHIKAGFLHVWTIVSSWSPEDRYKVLRYSKTKAKQFLHAVKIIIKELV